VPIRIYALAKELKIDSKELVDICERAGITGKGSALASVTDEEMAKVRLYLATGGQRAGAASATPSNTTPHRQLGGSTGESSAPAGRGSGPLSNIRSGGSAGTEAGTPTARDTRSEAPPSRDQAPPPGAARGGPLLRRLAGGTAAPTPPSPTPAETERLPAANAPSSPMKRDDYMAPGGVGRKPRLLDRRKPDGGDAEKPKPIDRKDDRAKRGPVVKLAAMPEVKTPPVSTRKEVAPQKPIMSLPPDALRSARTSGDTAPLREFTRQHEKKREPIKKAFEPAAIPPEGKSDRGVRDRRKGRDASANPEEGLAGMASARATRHQTRQRRGSDHHSQDEDGEPRRRARRLTRRGGTNTAAPRKGNMVVQIPCTVRSFSEATGVPTSLIQKTLMTLGTMATITASIDSELAALLAESLELAVDFKQQASLEDTVLTELADHEDSPDLRETRPPVVTFLGHVDHGKTSLLDRIIGINVVRGEAGGITQHIRAYRIEKEDRGIAFVDTPGHEAFTEMRARGAQVTDIAVLVVAADDGVMPQTVEAISHAKAAGVPIIVALNKCDLPGIDINRAMQSLSQHELLPTEWGGDVEVIKTSATTGEGIDTLLETILLTADIHEYTANPHRPAMGTCLEAQQEGSRGVEAKLIVKNGTLRVGDIVVCGTGYGRVKAMYNTLKTNEKLTEAGPSTPCNVTGLDQAPAAGEIFYVVPEISQAREIAATRESKNRAMSLSGRTVRVSFEEFQRRLEEGSLGSRDSVTTLNLILRADVRGSIEAIEKELTKLDHPEVAIQFLQKTVGGITVADVHLADASDAVIVGFNVIPDEAARSLAEQKGVEIRRYEIIYKVTEDIKALLEGKLEPEKKTTELGRALVQRVFAISRVGTVAGCRVVAGTIDRGCRIRVNRDGRGIGDYALDSLKREKDDARQVREGLECGIRLAGFNDIKEGDLLEAYKVEEVARTL